MYVLNQCTHYTYVDKTIANNEEFVKKKIKEVQPNWSDSICVAKKIQITADKDMMVKINGVDTLLIKADYGMTMEYDDADIKSMVSLTDGVRVYAVIGY